MSHVIPPSIEMLQMDEALAKLTPVADVLVAMAKGQSEPDGYPPLPMGSDADSYVGEAKVFSHDEMRAYVDADRAMRAADSKTAYPKLAAVKVFMEFRTDDGHGDAVKLGSLRKGDDDPIKVLEETIYRASYLLAITGHPERTKLSAQEAVRAAEAWRAEQAAQASKV